MKLNAILFCFVMISSISYAQSLDELFRKAEISFSKQDYKSAEQIYQKIIDQVGEYKDLYVVYTNLGTVQRRLDKKGKALESYDMANKLHPNSVYVLNNRATLRVQLKDYNGAMDDFTKSLQIDSLNEATLINRSHLFILMKDTASGLQDLYAVLKFKRSSVPAINNIADIQMARGQLNEAMKTFTDLLAENPGEWILVNNVGEVYFKMKDYDKAFEWANKAIKIKSNYDAPYITRGQVYMTRGDLKRAKKDFQKAIGLDTDDERAFNLLERCL